MRIAILGDIHGNLIGLEAVLEDIEAQGGAEDNAVNHLSEAEGGTVLEDTNENEIRYGEQ
jgi:hypothetical protein